MKDKLKSKLSGILGGRLKENLKDKLNLIIAGLVIVALIAVGIPLTVNTIETKTADIEPETVVSQTEAVSSTEVSETTRETKPETQPETELKIVAKKAKILNKNPLSKKQLIKLKKAKAKKLALAKKKALLKKKKAKAKKTSEKDKKDKKKKKSKPNFSYATAPKKSGVSYNAQWNAGYLVAIDNPDYGYHPAHVELSDYDRDLLERLCFGEFGDGGFTGAALVAQSVKDAMNTFGITSVKQVIKQLSYDGRTDHAAGKTIKDAVTYIFDMDKSAVQHRIIYMYDTAYVDSEFHETQKYVCTFKSTRFFDKK